MRLSFFGVLAPLCLSVVADKLVLKTVERLVENILIEYADYVNYTGPAENATASASSSVLPSTKIVNTKTNAATTTYWYEAITKQGLAPQAASGYTVFRNVLDYGATGDGVTDDTEAINLAISDGGRCGEGCASTTETPAVVYFPAGTYLISSSIIDYYYTSLVGDPNDPPTIKATAAFTGMGLINGNPYYTESLNWGSTNVFFRQIRNFIIDTTGIAASSSVMGLHWPTSQATSLQEITFNLNAESGTQHVGLFIESGSAGFLSDLTFNGGLIGAQIGNQQFTMRGLTFNNCVTAIWQLWSWSWTYIDISINSCGTGINMSPTGDGGDIQVGGIILIDSTFTDTPIGITTSKTSEASTWTNGTLIIENVNFVNVPIILQGPDATTFIEGSTDTTTVAAWGAGHEYTPTGPTSFQDTITANTRPTSLLAADGTNYYQMSKPQYEDLSASDFYSVRTAGAVGDGVTDDTEAVQSALTTALQEGKVCFFDMGIYKLTSTITIPVGSRVVGEWWPVLLSSGEFFNDQSNPQPVVKVGNTGGDAGLIQWTDMIVSGQGSQEGAIMIEYNLAGTNGSGMWDVHTRIGGFSGTDLQVDECPTTSTGCLGAFMSIHVTSCAANVYLENCWFWTADHDIDSDDNIRINIFTGRGMLVDNVAGAVWLVATAVEHHALYNYQFVGTKDIFGAQLQTETPYYMPTPNALNTGFAYNATWNDPDYATSCASSSAENCAMAWGLRVVDSTDLMLYGSNHYSFFTSYSTDCSDANGNTCQANAVSLEGSTGINIYGVNTVGTACQLMEDSTCLMLSDDNLNVYNELAALFRTD